MNNISNELTEKYKTILWLLDPVGNCGSGRSYLMAHAFVEHAQNNPNLQITVFDHHATDRREDIMCEVIDAVNKKAAEIANKEEREAFKSSFHFGRNTIKYC